MLADKTTFVSAGRHEVAKNLAPVPHPYTESHFRDFLARCDVARQNGATHTCAVTRAMDGALIGLCAVDRWEDGVWELGYWYGKPYWRQGYATEAARAVMRFAFEDLGALMLTAGWFFDNPASGRVLEKLGFVATGTMPRHCISRGVTVTSNRMLLTRDEFARKKAA
jgi:RimJ/RimL family protein N-acetyltransferase